MFIKFFKSSFFIQYLVIAILGGALWISAFLWPQTMPAPSGPVPLYKFLYDLLKDTPALANLIAFLLVLGEAYWLTKIFHKHIPIFKNSSLPTLTYVILMSYMPIMLTLNPVNIVVGFMILILYHLLIYFNKPDHLDRVFAAGFFTSIGGLIYIPFLIWCILLIISFLVLRGVSLRAWIASIIGLITPWIYLVAWYFWFDELVPPFQEYTRFFNTIFEFPITYPPDFWILSGYTVFIAFWGIVAIKKSSFEKTVELRTKANILMWTLVFAVLTIPLAGPTLMLHLSLAIPALAIVIAGGLTNLKNIRLAETLSIIYILTIFFNNLVQHFLLAHPE